MSKQFLNNQQQGILLLIAAALIWAPIPLIPGDTIGALIVVILGIFNLFR
jgi:hypothetical protein